MIAREPTSIAQVGPKIAYSYYQAMLYLTYEEHTMTPHVPKTINAKARDRLIVDLFERGISYDALPDYLFNLRMRDILEWLKSHYNLTYCYRCQRLTQPEEMIGLTNMCSKHTNRSTNSSSQRFMPNPEVLEELSNLLNSKLNGTEPKDEAPRARDSIVEQFKTKQKEHNSVEDIMRKLRKE
jgi:hypothetical protein